MLGQMDNEQTCLGHVFSGADPGKPELGLQSLISMGTSTLETLVFLDNLPSLESGVVPDFVHKSLAAWPAANLKMCMAG